MVNSTADAEDPDVAAVYLGLQEQIDREDGVSDELARSVLPIFFGPKFLEEGTEQVELHVDRMMRYPTTMGVEGLRALITRDSVVDQLPNLRVPSLVIHGELDAAFPISTNADVFVAKAPGAELVRIPDAGHSTPYETPDVVNEALAGFFARVTR